MTDILSLFIRAAFTVDLGCNVRTLGLKDSLKEEDAPFVRWTEDRLRQKWFHLTEEKIRQMGAMYKDNWRESPDDQDCHSLLFPLVHFVKDKAVYQGGQLKVKLDELLRWRQLAFAIGEDIMVCAWLAYHFRWNSQERLHVKWNISCEVYDADLQYIYGKGIADLHHHLKASTDVFSLSWICLMNHITHRYHDFEKMDGEVPSLYKACYEAAAIRMALYDYIRDSRSNLTPEVPETLDEWNMDRALKSLQGMLNIRRMERRGREKAYCYDYALPGDVHVDDMVDAAYVVNVFKGEHSLMYSVLRSVFRGAENGKTLSRLLFRYLQIKTVFRDYMVQTNQQVGFANFSRHERRKEVFLENYPQYEDLLSELPVAESMSFHHLEYLETRIAPKTDYSKMRGSVKKLDLKWKKWDEKAASPIGLIVHFIKRDSTPWKRFYERHYELRKDLRMQAVTLMMLRRRNKTIYNRLVGIDAANTELDCRPEVFAQAFRYVRKHADDVLQACSACDESRRALHYTYHVGEDFYDIVDGLRAIDEAVEFLELENGDRLGHCLALGTSPQVYYAEYNHIVLVKKQYLLDNIAWMMAAAKRYEAGMTSALEMALRDRFDTLVNELYGRSIDMDIYRKSMLLRGDSPYALYGGRERNALNALVGDWDSCAFRHGDGLTRLRDNEEIKRVFLDYHFNETVRKRGEEMESMKVNRDYENCVQRIQDGMMCDLCRRNIIIECCPSSNVKIGLTNRYDQHPVFRFNPIDDPGRQMPVTVNTDDLGIFQTSIDNEYSLLALAAMKMKDSDGRPRFCKRDIIQWLDGMRENGRKYAFRSVGTDD